MTFRSSPSSSHALTGGLTGAGIPVISDQIVFPLFRMTGKHPFPPGSCFTGTSAGRDVVHAGIVDGFIPGGIPVYPEMIIRNNLSLTTTLKRNGITISHERK